MDKPRRQDGQVDAAGDRLRASAATLDALRHGEIDALWGKGGVVALKGAERPYRAFFDAMNEGGVTLDEDGRVLFCNPRFAAMTGFGVAAIQGRRLREFVAPAAQASLAALISGGQAGACEIDLLTRDGAALPVRLSFTPMPLDARPLVCLVVTDLSERIAAERALRSANDELESFTYAVTHNLRSPLRAMCGFSRALLEDCGDQVQGDAALYLGQIDIAGRKMGELIDGILALSRCLRDELRIGRIDVSALAQRHLALLAAADPARSVAVSVAPGLAAQGDARMLEAALTCLLDNAWKYTGRTAAPEIRVFAEQRDGRRWFCVADNGAGFDMAHAARLFQPFQRLHRQEEFSGIGIGLATVQRIIHRHGGSIVATGEPGRGAAFRFTLPGDQT